MRRLGMLQPMGSGTSASLFVLDRPMSGLRFTEADEGGGWSWFIYNHGPVMQTGAIAKFLAQHFVRWAKG